MLFGPSNSIILFSFYIRFAISVQFMNLKSCEANILAPATTVQSCLCTVSSLVWFQYCQTCTQKLVLLWLFGFLKRIREVPQQQATTLFYLNKFVQKQDNFVIMLDGVQQLYCHHNIFLTFSVLFKHFEMKHSDNSPRCDHGWIITHKKIVRLSSCVITMAKTLVP